MTKKRKQYPSQARLRELFDYDPEGFLVWKTGPRSGHVAGCRGVNKYLYFFYNIRIKSVLYLGTRLIYIYHYGKSPKYIVAKDFNKSNTKIENLIGLDSLKGYSSGQWKNGKKYRFIQADGDGKTWFNSVGSRRYFYTKEAAAYFADQEIDRLGLMKQKNGIGYIDIEKYKAHGRRQEKNRNNRTSDFIGVSKHQKKWTVKCAHKYIGVFDSEEQAARAYNIAAYEHYGEHAVLNDIPDPLGKGDIF